MDFLRIGGQLTSTGSTLTSFVPAGGMYTMGSGELVMSSKSGHCGPDEDEVDESLVTEFFFLLFLSVKNRIGLLEVKHINDK